MDASPTSILPITQPETYNVFRKDRTEGGDGMFRCVKKEINVVEELSLNVDAKIIWIQKIMLINQAPAPIIIHLMLNLTQLLNFEPR